MVLRSRLDYLVVICLLFRRSSKKDKSIILNEFCAICGYNRKYAIWLMKKNPAGLSSRKRPRVSSRQIRTSKSLRTIFPFSVVARINQVPITGVHNYVERLLIVLDVGRMSENSSNHLLTVFVGYFSTAPSVPLFFIRYILVVSAIKTINARALRS